MLDRFYHSQFLNWKTFYNFSIISPLPASVIKPPGQVKDQKEEIPRIPETKNQKKEEDDEGEVLKLADDGIESDVTESDLELSDELTEVSSTGEYQEPPNVLVTFRYCALSERREA